ncbi:MAG: TM1812 family CRISPR-associated protein [Spirochaetia bacterium]|nr:TM1812 family CRISPR-associated protein [Spirochaetia bacterium]
MKKIIFCPITLQPSESFKAIYDVKQQDFFDGSTYSKKIYYPINVALANDLQKDDEVKVVLIRTKDERRKDSDKIYKANLEKFTTEFSEICDSVGAISNIKNPVIIESEFKETRDVFEERFMKFFEVLEDNVEIYADTTFGSRVFSMILMNVLNFAEKFFNAELKSVVYGQTSINNGEASDGIVYDISSLYYLNNITYALKAESGKEAIEAFKAFLND